jgi:S-adenosylmethionine:tRNA ribosyltransferase-isomerase
MKTAEFDFDLPAHLIADRPVEPRDAARLLVVEDKLQHRIVRDLPALLRPGDLLVLNDTRVIPARLMGRRGAARIEATLHKQVAAGRWRAFARPGRKLKPGDRIEFAPGFAAEVAGKFEGGEIELSFNLVGDELLAMLRRHGQMPLPPYIKRPPRGDEHDRADYQTVYAAKDGAVAAPTAGLHFTSELLRAIEARGAALTSVTLHVGAGTFLPVKVEDTRDHVMHSEFGAIDGAAAEAINRTRAAGGRVVAVGTTSLRLIESVADEAGRVGPFAGETDLFITPGHRFRAVDLLLTNFHLPRSTLFMLATAFAGTARIKAAYEHAKAAGYRFYSYGDCCLLQRAATS